MADIAIKKTTGFGEKLAYGIGNVGDSIPYALYTSFFLVYLTKIAGIPPGIAGIITAVPVIFNAFFDPVAGHVSDILKRKYGKRISLMGLIIIPYSVLTALLYIPVGGGLSFKYVYYILLGLCFWTSYSFWVIPYLSLVIDLTKNYEERNTLRMFSLIFSSVFGLFAFSGTLMVQDFFKGRGFSEEFAWAASSIMCSIVTGLSLFTCYIGLKNKEKSNTEENPDEKRENFFKVLKQCFKLKVFIQVIGICFTGVIASTLLQSLQMYLFYDRLKMAETDISLFYIFIAVLGLSLTVVTTKFLNYFGKKETYLAASIICIIGCIVSWQIGITSYATIILLAVSAIIFMNTFGLVEVNLSYDVAEIFAFKYGKRQDASLVALNGVVYKLAAAATTVIAGGLLSIIGFIEGGVTQDQVVLERLDIIATLPMAGFCLCSCLITFFYPVTKKRYNMLVDAAKARTENRKYDEAEIAKLIK